MREEGEIGGRRRRRRNGDKRSGNGRKKGVGIREGKKGTGKNEGWKGSGEKGQEWGKGRKGARADIEESEGRRTTQSPGPIQEGPTENE